MTRNGTKCNVSFSGALNNEVLEMLMVVHIRR